MENNLINLQDLVTTKYISPIEPSIEGSRAGSSATRAKPTNREDDGVAIHNNERNVVLTDDGCNQLHEVEDTPKLVEKKPRISMRKKDEAAVLLEKMRSQPPEVLAEKRYDYYGQKMHNTTRDSEMEMCTYVLTNPNARPSYFSVQCKNLDIVDLQSIIYISLSASPKDNGQNIVRLPIKPTNLEFCFKNILEIFENIGKINTDFQYYCGGVFLSTADGKNKIRFETKDYQEYAIAETNLENLAETSTAKIVMTCSLKNWAHVSTQITYFCNFVPIADGCRMNRFIELEQTVKCNKRRVVIAEDTNVSFEFDVEDEMTSLRQGLPPVHDLIHFMHTGCLSEGEEEEEEGN